MNTNSIGILVFVCVFGATLVGILLHAVLPKNHLSTDSKEVIKVAIGLVATMTALLLGLLIASAKGSYDSQQNRVVQMAAKVAILDRALVKCGPDSDAAREQLRGNVAHVIGRIWPADRSTLTQLDPVAAEGDKLYATINRILPQNDEQQAAKIMALKIATDIGELYSELFAKAGTTIPTPLLVVVVCWLVIIFLSFGLFTPPNGTVIAALLAAALSVSTALHMIIELDRAFGGVIQVSSEPMRTALDHLAR